MSTKFVAIDTQAAMDELLCKVNGFHDALLREVAIIAQGYVHPDGDMFGYGAPSDIRLVIQSQLEESPCIEIVAEELQRFRWEDWDLDPAQGVVDESGVTLSFDSSPDAFTVCAKKMSYRILGPESLGERLLATQRIIKSDDQ